MADVWAYYGRMGDEAAGPEIGCELFATKEEAYRAAFDEMFYDEDLFEEEIDEAIRAVLKGKDFDDYDDDDEEAEGDDEAAEEDADVYYGREKFDSLTFAQQVKVLERVEYRLTYNIDRIFEVHIQGLTLPKGVYISNGKEVA